MVAMGERLEPVAFDIETPGVTSSSGSSDEASRLPKWSKLEPGPGARPSTEDICVWVRIHEI